MESLSIQTPGYQLSANLFSPDEQGKHPAALFIHGWQSNQERNLDTAEILAKQGFVCLTFDLPGHGKTEGNLGTLTSKDFLEEAIAAYDFLATQEHVDSKQIGVVGGSYGGFLALLLSTKRNLAWLALRVPADYPDETFEQPKSDIRGAKAWRELPRDWQGSKALRALHAFTGRVLIIESEHDDAIPHQTILNFREAVADTSQCTYVFMKGAPHSFTGHPEFKREYNKILRDWLLSSAVV